MKFIIVSGLSGAGKSVTLQTLEDHHFYCMDNMPLEFLDKLSEQLVSARTQFSERIAVSIDVRNVIARVSNIRVILDRVAAVGFDSRLIFLRASEESLENRYSETRRPHPLSARQNKPLKECIRSEIALLDEIASSADICIDTTNMSRYELCDTVAEHLALRSVPLSILLQSFGYKKGIPQNSDYVFDVRCLTNPYWVSRLRAQSGCDAGVRDFLEQLPQSIELFNDIFGFLKKWLHYYESTMRSYITISIGCTGGRHRSVYLVEKLYLELAARRPLYDISKVHRDI